MKIKKNGFWILLLAILFFVFLFSFIHLYDRYVYEALNRMVYSLETKYPDMEIDFVEALRSEEDIPEVLEKYGITIDSVKNLSHYQSFRMEIILFAFLFVFLIGGLFLAIYFIQKYKIKKEIRIINQYLQNILNNQYELHIADYQEDELSVLKNDIYKVTVKLKELSSYEKREQHFLMKTLEDISHQLKTPLTALTIINDILMNPDLTKEERLDFLKKESKELEKMEWLITTLLKLSKLESGQVDVKKEKIIASQLVDDSLESLLIPLELKQVQVLKKNLDFSLLVDPSWMREALTNILKNAYEHSNEGGKIVISGDDNPVYQAIIITDNGKGIKMSEIKNIFKRFYSTSSSKNSMGIGLNMARVIIEKHHGKIEVLSEEGKYTTFKIIFMKKNC